MCKKKKKIGCLKKSKNHWQGFGCLTKQLLGSMPSSADLTKAHVHRFKFVFIIKKCLCSSPNCVRHVF